MRVKTSLTTRDERISEMIVRLIVAFARWTWGISPAFPSADTSNEAWVVLMVFGAMIDIVAITLSTTAFIDWIKDSRVRKEDSCK